MSCAQTLPLMPSPSRPAILDAGYRGQPLLTAVAVLFVLAAVPSVLALVLDSRTLNGSSVWVKPLKFQASFAIHALTMAWMLLLLPEAERARRAIVVLAAVFAAAAVFELAYIGLQAARGQASHYNLATPLSRLMYGLMGVGAVTMMIVTASLGAIVLRCGTGPRALVLGAGLGLILASVLGGVTGAYMARQPGHWVGGLASDAGGLPIVGWSRTGGDLRAAHFVGLHAMQILPVAAWLATRLLSMRWQQPAVWLTAAAVTLATAAVFVQAIAGRPLVPV